MKNEELVCSVTAQLNSSFFILNSSFIYRGLIQLLSP